MSFPDQQRFEKECHLIAILAGSSISFSGPTRMCLCTREETTQVEDQAQCIHHKGEARTQRARCIRSAQQPRQAMHCNAKIDEVRLSQHVDIMQDTLVGWLGEVQAYSSTMHF